MDETPYFDRYAARRAVIPHYESSFDLFSITACECSMLLGAVNQSCITGSDKTSYMRVHGRWPFTTAPTQICDYGKLAGTICLEFSANPKDLKCIREGGCDGDEDTKLPSNLDALMKLPNPLFEFGIYGKYSFKLTWVPEDRHAAMDPSAGGPTLFTAIQEQLGLKLEAQKAPVGCVIIDHIEQPSPN